MLREYQDQIKALRQQLDATQRGVMIREDGTVSIYARSVCICTYFVWMRGLGSRVLCILFLVSAATLALQVALVLFLFDMCG